MFGQHAADLDVEVPKWGHALERLDLEDGHRPGGVPLKDHEVQNADFARLDQPGQRQTDRASASRPGTTTIRYSTRSVLILTLPGLCVGSSVMAGTAPASGLGQLILGGNRVVPHHPNRSSRELRTTFRRRTADRGNATLTAQREPLCATREKATSGSDTAPEWVRTTLRRVVHVYPAPHNLSAMVVPGAACKASRATPNNMGPTLRIDGDPAAAEGSLGRAIEWTKRREPDGPGQMAIANGLCRRECAPAKVKGCDDVQPS